MKKVLRRDQYLQGRNINEALANEINWGDSLIGRLLNSILRKAQVGINLVKIDRVIERLKAEFESLVDLIKINDDENLKIRAFYLAVSVLLGQLIKEIEEGKDIKEIINISKGIKNDVNSLETPNNETMVDKKEVISKLEEFIKQIGEIEKVDVEEPEEVESEVKVEKKPLEKKPLSLGVGIDPKILALDVAKVTPQEAKLKLPQFTSSLSFLAKEIEKIKTEIVSIKSSKRQLSDENKEEFKKLWKTGSLLLHPDRFQESGFSTEEEAKDIFQQFQTAYQNGDYESMREIYQKAKQLVENRKKERIIKEKQDELEKKSKSTEQTSKDNMKALGPKKEVPEEKSERRVHTYLSFLNEAKEEQNKDIDDDTLKGESKDIHVRLKDVFDSIFTEEFMIKYQVTDEDKEKFKDTGKRTLTIDPIIEIVKIFNRAYKIHTPGIIPSGRRGGKVSNRVFREYEYVGKGDDDARLDEEGGVKPGIGPYRNRAVFNKWENAVLDIIKDPKYQEIFNEKTVFKFGNADTRVNKKGTKEGGGKALLKFINEMLDGSALYRKGAQHDFIIQYFGVTVADKDLGYNEKDIMGNSEVAENVEDDKFLEFKNLPKDLKPDNLKNVIFKAITTEENRVWVFRVIKVENNKIFFIMTNGFPYDLRVKDLKTKTYLSPDGRMYIGSANWQDFKNGSISKKRIEIVDGDNFETKEDFISKLKNLQVLYKDDKIFKESSKLREVTHRKKFNIIEDKEKNNKELTKKL